MEEGPLPSVAMGTHRQTHCAVFLTTDSKLSI